MNFLEKDPYDEINLSPTQSTLIVSAAILFVICFLLLMTNHSGKLRDSLNKISKKEIKGVITDKWLDESNRNEPYIKINDTVKSEYRYIWNQLEKGDRVYKPKNSYILTITRKDTVIEIDYDKVYDNMYKH